MLRRTTQLLLGLFYEVLRRLLCREHQLLSGTNEISPEYIWWCHARTHLRVGTQTCMANIWGAHGGDRGGYLPEYKAAQLDRYLPTFRRKALPHFHGIWRRQVPSKHRRTSTRLSDVISKKTTVLTSGPSFPKGTHFIKPVGFLC